MNSMPSLFSLLSPASRYQVTNLYLLSANMNCKGYFRSSGEEDMYTSGCTKG